MHPPACFDTASYIPIVHVAYTHCPGLAANHGVALLPWRAGQRCHWHAIACGATLRGVQGRVPLGWHQTHTSEPTWLRRMCHGLFALQQALTTGSTRALVFHRHMRPSVDTVNKECALLAPTMAMLYIISRQAPRCVTTGTMYVTTTSTRSSHTCTLDGRGHRQTWALLGQAATWLACPRAPPVPSRCRRQ